MNSVEIPGPTLLASNSILEAARLMVSNECSEVFVLGDDERRPVGVVRYGDIVRSVASGNDPRKTEVGRVMLRPPPMVEEDATMEEVSKVLVKTEMKRVLVGRDKEIVGLLEAGELFSLISASLQRVEAFKAVSVRSRLRMAELLSVRPMSVEEISEELGIKPITVRHHLDVLRRSGMVEEVHLAPLGKVGRPAGMFKLTHSVLKRGSLGAVSYTR